MMTIMIDVKGGDEARRRTSPTRRPARQLEHGALCGTAGVEGLSQSSSPGTPSVDQLSVLLAVAKEGSFTGAARRLGRRANSAISYAIDMLERSLALPL